MNALNVATVTESYQVVESILPLVRTIYDVVRVKSVPVITMAALPPIPSKTTLVDS